MTLEEIRADVAAFADNEENVLVGKGTLIFERDRRTYECRLFETSAGQIDIEYDGRRMPYFKFLAEELGRLPILAQAIKEKRPDVNPYVDTQAVLIDAMGKKLIDHTSGLTTLRSRCDEHVFGETRLIFLTGDAGEGKTALLRRLTRLMAEKYTTRQSSWFLLHIDTQGRAFVRLEEAVASELGQLRISGLFYSGVIRLIRHGLLAIAIDGFDELLAEIGSSEAYSGLGAFLRQLDGAGVVVAAARSAYFEAENYAAQSRLLSSLPDVQVTVEQMRLEKWEKKETVSFFEVYRASDGSRISNPAGLYAEIAALVDDPDHVILHRPFLVQQMAKMLATSPSSTREVIHDIGSGLRVVPNVIRAFLKREVEEKWRDQAGQPYLTLEQHVGLLAAIADEMWTQSNNSLQVEMVQLVAETFIDDLRIPSARKVQILERVKAHAFLPQDATRRPDHRAFDHEQFLNYFLAARLVELLKGRDKNSLRRFLEKHSLPAITATWASVIEPWTAEQAKDMIAGLSEMSSSELLSGYLKQNAGLVAAVMTTVNPNRHTFDSMYFEGVQWAKTRLVGCEFRRCVFNDVDLTNIEWIDCAFRECQVQGLTVDHTSMQNCTFDESCRVVGILQSSGISETVRIFVPDVCEKILKQSGARFLKAEERPVTRAVPPVPDDRRRALESFLRIFNRNSGAVESVIGMKLGPRKHIFDDKVLPALLDHGVVRKTEYRGHGHQDRFELAYPLDLILGAEDPQSGAPSQLIAFWNSLRN